MYVGDPAITGLVTVSFVTASGPAIVTQVGFACVGS
jgi:hypothetical protein